MSENKTCFQTISYVCRDISSNLQLMQDVDKLYRVISTHKNKVALGNCDHQLWEEEVKNTHSLGLCIRTNIPFAMKIKYARVTEKRMLYNHNIVLLSRVILNQKKMCLKDSWNLRWAKDDTIIVRGLLAGQDILERDYEIWGPG